jgi:guanylate kinase
MSCVLRTVTIVVMDKKTFISTAMTMQPQYVPNDKVKAHLSQVDLVAVIGPTGAGKNAIIEESGIPYIRSDMTRAPRKNETDGVDANFRADYDGLMREIKDGLFVQFFVNRNGEFYGTKDSSYPDQGFCAMPIYADALNEFKSLPFNKIIMVYIVPPSYEELLSRAKKHHDSDMPARLIEAKRSLEAALSDTDYHFILNDNLDQATAMFKEYIATQTVDAAAEKQARDIALGILTHLN